MYYYQTNNTVRSCYSLTYLNRSLASKAHLSDQWWDFAFSCALSPIPWASLVLPLRQGDLMPLETWAELRAPLLATEIQDDDWSFLFLLGSPLVRERQETEESSLPRWVSFHYPFLLPAQGVSWAAFPPAQTLVRVQNFFRHGYRYLLSNSMLISFTVDMSLMSPCEKTFYSLFKHSECPYPCI